MNFAVIIATVSSLTAAVALSFVPDSNMDAPAPMAAVVVTDAASPTNLTLAEAARNSNRHLLAMRHATFAHQKEPGSIAPLTVYRDTMQDWVFLALADDKHWEVAERINALYGMVDRAQSIIASATNAQPLVELLAIEADLRLLQTSLVHDASTKAHGYLRDAEQACEEAAPWYGFLWWNDRNDVVSGMRSLNWIFVRLDQVDPLSRGEFFRIQNRLREAVSAEEWDVIRASADMPTHEF